MPHFVDDPIGGELRTSILSFALADGFENFIGHGNRGKRFK